MDVLVIFLISVDESTLLKKKRGGGGGQMKRSDAPLLNQ